MAQTPPHINSLFPSQYIVHFWLSLIGKIISFPQKHVFPAYKKMIIISGRTPKINKTNPIKDIMTINIKPTFVVSFFSYLYTCML